MPSFMSFDGKVDILIHYYLFQSMPEKKAFLKIKVGSKREETPNIHSFLNFLRKCFINVKWVMKEILVLPLPQIDKDLFGIKIKISYLLS